MQLLLHARDHLLCERVVPAAVATAGAAAVPAVPPARRGRVRECVEPVHHRALHPRAARAGGLQAARVRGLRAVGCALGLAVDVAAHLEVDPRGLHGTGERAGEHASGWILRSTLNARRSRRRPLDESARTRSRVIFSRTDLSVGSFITNLVSDRFPRRPRPIHWTRTLACKAASRLRRFSPPVRPCRWPLLCCGSGILFESRSRSRF